MSANTVVQIVKYVKPNKNNRVYEKWEPAVAKEGRYIISHDAANPDGDWSIILAKAVDETMGKMVTEWENNKFKAYPEDWIFYYGQNGRK